MLTKFVCIHTNVGIAKCAYTKYGAYDHMSTLFKLMLVNLLSRLVIHVQSGGVTTCNFDRFVLSLPYVPVQTTVPRLAMKALDPNV